MERGLAFLVQGEPRFDEVGRAVVREVARLLRDDLLDRASLLVQDGRPEIVDDHVRLVPGPGIARDAGLDLRVQPPRQRGQPAEQRDRRPRDQAVDQRAGRGGHVSCSAALRTTRTLETAPHVPKGRPEGLASPHGGQ
jgi:hypothetical protein